MWIEIFKSGTQTDSSGITREYTESSLDEIARIYNEAAAGDPSMIAPVVKGHPADDSPAYGWVERLARRGKILLAKLKDINPEFAEEVNSGAFRKISMAIYPDMMLRHVGFLGGSAPAVKGLTPVKFSSDKSFGEFESNIICLTEHPNSNQIFAENANLKQKISELEKELRTRGFAEFAVSLISGQTGALIKPSQTDTVVEILEMAFSVDENSRQKGNFCENNAMVDKMKKFFTNLKPLVSTGEFARNGETDILRKDFFKESNVLPDRLKLHRRSLEICESRPGVSYEDAVLIAENELK